MAPLTKHAPLKLGHTTAMYVGAVLGPGVLVLPALATRAAGPAAVLAWAGLLALSVPVALSFARLAARYPSGGGVAEFVARAFGPRAAAPVAWWFYLCGVPFGVLGGALVGGQYVVHALGGGNPVVVAVLLLAAAFAANCAGLHVSARVQLLLVCLLAALLVLAVALGATHVSAADFTPFAPHGWAAIGQAAVVLFYAFSGWEAASHLSAELPDPRRATRLTLAVVGVLYLGLAATTAGLDSDVPLMALLERDFGPSARVVTAVAAVVLSFGAINTYIAGGARLGATLGPSPRQSLAALAVLCALVTAATVVWRVELDVLMRVTSVALAAVTAAGMAAAVKLLPRRAPAVAALGFTLVVLAFSGALLLVPVALGAAALLSARVGWAARAGRSSA